MAGIAVRGVEGVPWEQIIFNPRGLTWKRSNSRQCEDRVDVDHGGLPGGQCGGIVCADSECQLWGLGAGQWGGYREALLDLGEPGSQASSRGLRY